MLGDSLARSRWRLLRSELDGGASATAVMTEFRNGIEDAIRRVMAISPGSYESAWGGTEDVADYGGWADGALRGPYAAACWAGGDDG